MAMLTHTDAHATRTQTSLTGHLHGMVLSFLMDLDKAREVGR